MLPYSGFPALPNKMEDMHKQLVALGLNDVEALTARIKKCEAWVAAVEETELTGNPVIYQNALAVPARSLKTTIEAIQDLHGLPFPYVGGAYKNKLPMTVANLKSWNTEGTWSGNIYTINGAVFEILTDNGGNVIGIKKSGTAIYTATLLMYVVLGANSYKANGCPDNGSLNTYTLQLKKNNVSGQGIVQIEDSSDNSFTLSEETTVCEYIRCGDGDTSEVVFYPMIRLASESDASFAPYSNICPISGRTEARVGTENEDSTESAYAVIQLGTTVYGAYINWDTGVATVTHAYWQILSTDLVEEYLDDTNNQYLASYTPTQAPIPTGDINIVGKAICNIMPVLSQNVLFNSAGSAICVMANIARFRLTLANCTTFEQMKTWIDNNPTTICYELATPTTIQLTPTQLQMLKGYNRVSIDNGSIEIKAYTGGPWEAVTRTIKKVTNKTKTTKKRRK